MIFEKNRHTQLIGVAAAMLTVVLLFHAYGVTVWQKVSSDSIFGWLYMMWSRESTEAVDYSHGMVIPFASLWLLWRRRAALRAAFTKAEPHLFGPALWAMAIFMHFAGMRAQIPHLSALGFIVALWSLAWTFAGREAARQTLFPLAFLLFAIPVGFLAHATFPLRLFGSVASAAVLNGLGIATERIGTAVYSTAGQGFAMDVADACSGIRSIMALMALTAAYAYLFRTGGIERWFLFLMSVPIAAAANIGRIVTIAVVAHFMGQDAGMKIYHDYSGYLVFILAVLLVVAVSALMDKLKNVLRDARTRARDNSDPPDLVSGVKKAEKEASGDFQQHLPPPTQGRRAAGYIPAIVWILLLAAAVPLLHSARRAGPAGPLPEEWHIPDSIGEWRGERLYYSTDPAVTRAFREEDILQPGVCPVSGAPLDSVSAAERRLLPSDIEIQRRLFSGPDGLFRHVIILITGESREGIHRPEWCLLAQGVRIGTRYYLNAKDKAGRPFGVAIYPMFSRNAPENARPGNFFVYWFEGPDAKTPYNLIRILRMGWDRFRSGRAQRWAYFSIQMNIPPGGVGADASIVEAVEWLVHSR